MLIISDGSKAEIGVIGTTADSSPLDDATETVIDTLNLKACLFAIQRYFDETGARVMEATDARRPLIKDGWVVGAETAAWHTKRPQANMVQNLARWLDCRGPLDHERVLALAGPAELADRGVGETVGK